MRAKLVISSWGEFSSTYVRYQSLPNGSELRLRDSSGRRKRSDFRVKRRQVTSPSVSRLQDDDSVSALIKHAVSLLSTDLFSRHLTAVLHGPDGKPVNGNTSLRSVRKMQGKPTVADLARDFREMDREEEIQQTARVAVQEAEHMVDDPARTVCRAFVATLIDRYGRNAVREALGK